MVSCSNSASTCLEALFAALFVLAIVVMVPSVGLNAYFVYSKIKERMDTRIVHEVHKFVSNTEYSSLMYYAS